MRAAFAVSSPGDAVIPIARSSSATPASPLLVALAADVDAGCVVSLGFVIAAWRFFRWE